jgi:hypothetical protein
MKVYVVLTGDIDTNDVGDTLVGVYATEQTAKDALREAIFANDGPYEVIADTGLELEVLWNDLGMTCHGRVIEQDVQ